MLKKIFNETKSEYLFQYRNVWMGISILLVLFYHTGLGDNFIMSCIRSLAVIAVDIFIFSSGIGCYYSLAKNNDIVEFLKRRFIKLMPTYWIFIIVWLVYKISTTNILPTAILGNLLCIQIFTNLGDYFNWYISAIWLLYFLAPYFKGIIDNLTTFKQYFIVTVVLVIFSIPFFNSDILVMATRIPIFFIGMYFGKLGKEKKVLSKKNLLLLLVSMIIGVIILFYFYIAFATEQMWNYGLCWYPFILITPGACIFISYLMEFTKKIKFQNVIKNGLSFFGAYSFELYLIHILIFDIYIECFVANGIGNKSVIEWIIVILIVFPCCFILKLCEKYIIKLMNQIIKKS